MMGRKLDRADAKSTDDGYHNPEVSEDAGHCKQYEETAKKMAAWIDPSSKGQA